MKKILFYTQLVFPQPAEIDTHGVKIGFKSSTDMTKPQSSCVVNEARSFK